MVRRLILLSTLFLALAVAPAAQAATLSLSPAEGPPGANVRATGSGYGKKLPGTLTFGSQQVATFKSHPGKGTLDQTFQVPGGATGQNAVTARTSVGTGTASFNVTGAPPPPPPPGDVTTQPVDGGANYYGQFGNALPSDPSYFPIGVWGAYNFTAENVAKDKDVGLNLYVWNADTAAWGQQEIANAGMYTFQEVGHNENIGAHTRGWMLTDEPDLRLGPSGYQEIEQKLAQVPDSRVTYVNLGKAAAHPDWPWTVDQQARFVNAGQDITSADVYFHTDPYQVGDPESGTSWGYGATVDHLRMLDARDGKRQPIWNFVEVAWPWSEQPGTNGLDKPTPAEIRGAVWHSIIAGARGIIYFQHSFTGPCTTHHALRETGSACYGAVIDTVRSVNQQITNLAPDLNSPTVTSGFTYSPTSSVRAMAKLNGSQFTIIAGSKVNASSNATFTLPVGNTTATVVGEGRTIPVVNGSWTDSFGGGNAIHIYRIG
jgi:hypothetical protein